MDIATSDTIERRYGAEAAAEWRVLLNQFALGDGFALLVLSVPGPDGAALCADELDAFLGAQGRHLAYVASRTTEELRQLTPRLLSLPKDAATGAVWVMAVIPDALAERPAWEAAWRVALSSLNQQRNPLRREVDVPLIVVGAPWLVPLMRESAPDLWSVRSMVVRIEPARGPGLALPGLIESEPVLLGGRDDRGAQTAPDPALAMREAARLRGVPGREQALADLLARAGDGFAARGALHAAEDAWREAAELGGRSGSPATAAAAWHALAVVRHELGEREAALAAAREAAVRYRALPAQHPGAFRPDLAASLNALAIMLSDLGEHEAALAAAREAADLYRALAAQRPDAFRPDLAMSLNNLANMLSALGEREAALAAAREAVEIRRALAAQRPDAFRPNLAGSLNNLATMLSDLGEREAALAAAREAVEIRRALAAQRPDAFRPDLARSISVRADCLDAMGQLDLALADDVEAITVLTPAFNSLPQAFAPLISAMVRDYKRRCEKHGTEPDQALLAPIVAEFTRMQAQPEQAA